MTALPILLVWFGLTAVNCLTQAEIEAFKASGEIELNTGVAGFVEIVSTDDEHTINSNGVPDHDTPDYPTQHNPNDISVQDFAFTFPINPTFAEKTTELPMGAIGLAINGVALFNPYTIEREDAVQTEIFDSCDGHPSPTGTYHYHKMPSSCVFTVEEGIPSGIVGVARDGFPIYGPIDEDGTRLTSDDLDDCHGKMSSGGEYRYHTTDDFPYILGCFKGTVEISGGGPPPNTQSTTPPSGNGAQIVQLSSLRLLFIALWLCSISLIL
ncbi:uncharacterized protein LOC117100554 [Anneissia japonica]|uniref:uncharacterized protein LOC117100554 n=1 Tax=Anneissia japonica TaxID=1529436 RepID=UPI0014255CE9|nr:uncharacterized protein LOC117100554 [Anneissia japonica]